MRKSIFWIDKQDLLDIAILLQRGYPLEKIFKMLDKYPEFLKRIQKGENFLTFINFKKRDHFHTSLNFFIHITTFEKAIISAFEYEEMKKKLRNEWLKDTSYPLFVFTFSLIVFLLFESLIVPQLTNMIQLTEGLMLYHLLVKLIHWMLMIFFIVVLLGMGFVFLLLTRQDIIEHLYERFLGKISFVKKIISYEYALHSLVLMKRGYSTKQVFEQLLHLKKFHLLTIDIKRMIEKFNQGKDILEMIYEEQHFDHKFKHFFKMGVFSDRLENALEDYCHFQEKEFKRLLKVSSKFVSLFSYSFIGLLVISVYQMLMIPLEMMNQF